MSAKLRLDDLHSYVERTFRHVAEAKNVDFHIRLGPEPADARCSPTPSGCSRSSRTCCPTPSSSRITASVTLDRRAGARRLEPGQRRPQSGGHGARLLGVATPASAFRRTSSRSSSRRSSRPTAAPAASTAAPAWAWPSAANCRACWAARFAWPARPARAAHSPSTCRRSTRRQKPAHASRPCAAPPTPARRAGARPRRPAAGSAGAEEPLLDQRGRRRPRRHPPRRSRAADRRKRPGLRPLPAGAAREKGFKGLVTSLGAAALAMAREYKPDAMTLGHLPARHRRLARPGAAQERHRHPAHSGLRHLHRGGARARPEVWRAGRGRPSRSRPRRRWSGRWTTGPSRVAARQGPAAWSARRRAAPGESDAIGDERRSRRRRRPPARRRWRSCGERRIDCVILHPDLPDMSRRRWPSRSPESRTLADCR